MVNPTNYALGGPDPVQQLFEGVGAGMGIRAQEQQMDIAASQEERAAEMHQLNKQKAALAMSNAAASNARAEQAAAMQQAQAQRQEAFQVAMGQLAIKGTDATAEDYQQVATQFPEFGASVMESLDGMTDARKEGMTTRLMQIGSALKMGQAGVAMDLAEEYAQAAENSGDPGAAATARAMVETMKIQPDAAQAALGLMLTTIDPSASANVFGGAKVQSSQLIEGRVSVQTMSDGSTRVVDTATGEVLRGDAANEAIRQAEAAGIERQGGRAGAREESTLAARTEGAEGAKAAEALGAKRGEIVTGASDAIANVTNSLRNYDRAIAAIDAGGKTGVLYNRLPNISQESAELKNALDGLGLDVIGSVTFGALSEGELALAMDVAAPRNLPADELKAWIEERRDAQRKVRESLLEMQVFLSDPNNSLQGWYEQVRRADQDDASDDDGPDADLSDLDFMMKMQDQKARGEPFTAEQRARIQRIAGG